MINSETIRFAETVGKNIRKKAETLKQEAGLQNNPLSVQQYLQVNTLNLMAEAITEAITEHKVESIYQDFPTSLPTGSFQKQTLVSP